MKTEFPESAYTETERLVYFARMCNKARLMLEGKLHSDYHPYIGVGFDGRCCRLLKVSYEDIKRLVAEGKTDDEILEWCYSNGYRPTDDEVFVWNLFMIKRGWRDDDSEYIATAKKELGLEDKVELLTLFDLFEYEEERR